jgi:EF hand
MEDKMTSMFTVRRSLLAAALVASAVALPAMTLASDEAAARAAAASDPEYAAHVNSWSAMRKMKPMDVMHMVDADKKGYVTKEEFIKFQEQFFDRMDRDHDGKVTAQEWMGGGGKGASSSAKK